jgi:hypothetical protein
VGFAIALPTLQFTHPTLADDSEVFNVTVTVTGVNDAPVLVSEIADQQTTVGEVFNFEVPENSFTDVDPDDELTYTVTLSDGSELPAWLTFDAASRTLSGRPEAEETLSIRVNATDNASESVFDEFDIAVGLSGINDLSKIEISVYPNPSSGIIHVSLDNSKIKIFDIEVKYLAGKTIISKTGCNSAKINKIDLSKQQKGAYIIQLKIGKRKINRKVVIQ